MTAAQRATLEQMLDADLMHTVLSQREADALRAALGTCGNCEYAATEHAPKGSAFCTARMDYAHPFAARRMPLGERCTGWTRRRTRRRTRTNDA